VNNSFSKSASPSYLKLIHEFPLRHIKSEAQLDAAILIIDRLLQQRLDAGATDYLDVLTDLVEAYEERTTPVREVSAIDVLRELMRSNSLTQQQLSKKVGISQSTISAILNGSREMTVEHMKLLGAPFNLSPAVFMPSH